MAQRKDLLQAEFPVLSIELFYSGSVQIEDIAVGPVGIDGIIVTVEKHIAQFIHHKTIRLKDAARAQAPAQIMHALEHVCLFRYLRIQFLRDRLCFVAAFLRGRRTVDPHRL